MQTRAIQNTPGGKAKWEQRKNWFSKSYREFRDSDGAEVQPVSLGLRHPQPARAPEPPAPPAETKPQ